jgi:hypothetical protein
MRQLHEREFVEPMPGFDMYERPGWRITDAGREHLTVRDRLKVRIRYERSAMKSARRPGVSYAVNVMCGERLAIQIGLMPCAGRAFSFVA